MVITKPYEHKCSEYNSQLWNSGVEEDKETARKQKRRLSFYSNIYVVKDPANPENEGKVFLYKYGKKIFDKLNDLMNPQDDLGDAVRVNPFDLWGGANFRLRISTIQEYPNYDKSSFDPPAPLLDNDDDLEAVWRSQYKLQDLLAPSEFKTYEELKDHLQKVLRLNIGESAVPTPKSEAKFEMEAPTFKKKDSPIETKFNVADDEDDDLAFFRNLKEDD